jgi:hypothetical protein
MHMNRHANETMEYTATGLKKLLTDVSNHYTTRSIKMAGNTWRVTYSNQLNCLGECACAQGTFERGWTPRRVQTESRILKELKRTPVLDAKKSLNYLSLGAGLLLQDFIICGLLLMAGYSVFVRLIEKNRTTPNYEQAYEQFKCLQLFAEGMGLTFVAESYSTLWDYMDRHPRERIDIGCAIDFDGYEVSPRAISDFHLAYQLLAKQGFFYLSFKKSDFLLREKTSLIYRDSDIASAKEIRETHQKIADTSQEIAAAINISSSRIAKHIVEYMGLFGLKKRQQLSICKSSSSISSLSCR